MESGFALLKEEADIVGQCRQALKTVVQSKFGCTAILHGMNATSWDSRAAKKSKVSAEERYSIHLSRGLKVSVWKDDLTTHEVDAVVNAANEELNHFGGLALALAEAGGPSIQQESDQIVKQHGKVPTGEAVVTSPGFLPCKLVIHAVGPRVNWNPTDKEVQTASKLLERVIDNILKTAERHNLQSVAIPAISSGIFNFPLDRCANIIVKRLKAYNDSFHKNKLSEIRLVNHDDLSVNQMVRACTDIFGSSKSYSGAVKGSGRGSIKDSGKSSFKPPVKLNNVTLHIMKGYIERQTTSVIVNTTAPELDLSSGAVSKAILKGAGKELQFEIEKYRHRCQFGDVLPTKGYNLNSRTVYHVLCAHNRPGSYASQILSDVVTKCLHMAENAKCDSISFPAIGSGVLEFSKKDVAQIMTKAVKDFSSVFRGHSMDVRFVIYPSDEDTFQEFVKEFESLQHSSPYGRSLNSDLNESSTHNKSEAPYIELRSAFLVAQQAAKKWIKDLLNIQRRASNVHTIKDNHVLHFGLKEHEELLTLQVKYSVGIEVSFTSGQAAITIMGTPAGVIAAVLEVEAMCCRVQVTHALEEEASMLYSLVRWRCKDCPQLENPKINAVLEKAYLAGNDDVIIDEDTRVNVTLKEMTTKNRMKSKIDRICFFKHYNVQLGMTVKSYFDRKPMEHGKVQTEFRMAGLQVVHAETVENYALQQLFELSKKHIPGSPKLLYQCVPAQCCHLISWVGFQRDYAPPDVQNLGEGIYFTRFITSAMKLWKGEDGEEYVYIIEAEVLTGNDVHGSPDLIVPPPQRGGDPLIRYDSVKGGTDTVVVFNGHQALPRHIYTCKKINEGSGV